MPRRTVSVPTIQQIRDHKFAGNHAQDFKMFERIDAFLFSSAPESERLEAFNIFGQRGMGEDEPGTVEQMNDYLAELRRHGCA